MMKFLKTLQRHQYFFGFVFLFGYAQSIQGRILVRQVVDIYTFTPEAAAFTFMQSCIVFFIIAKLLGRFQAYNALNFVDVIKVFLLSLLLYLLVANVITAVAALVFDTWSRNFTHNVLLNNNIGYALDVCIYGSFFIAYFFYQKSKKDAKRLIIYHQALADSKIAHLKAQLNPHFLFNNLNSLDQLILEDQNKASVFLNDFAELYRYVLEVSKEKLVSIKDELVFVQSYFRMMQYKLNHTCELKIDTAKEVSGFVAPLALQLLVENALEHNSGTEVQPIKIQIEVTDQLIVTNNIATKKKSKIGGGRALQNLSEQYTLLSSQPCEIIRTETTFTVRLPLINSAIN